jgi:hypothetical protein
LKSFCFCAMLQVALRVIRYMQSSQMNISNLISNILSSQLISSTSYPKSSNCSSLRLFLEVLHCLHLPLSEGRKLPVNSRPVSEKTKFRVHIRCN